MPAPKKYPDEVRERAVRMVFQIRDESGQPHGVIARVADKLGINRETLRNWILCRGRHKIHYADLRVMPTWSAVWWWDRWWGTVSAAAGRV